MTKEFDAPLTAQQASRALASGRVTSTALVEDSLARIGALDPALHSFIRVTAARARKAAQTADRARRSGRRIGPLHGVPFALKDIIDVAGIATTAHSRVLLDNVPREHATVTRRLLDAGAILIGKLGTHEFATGGPAFDLPFPPPRNPWDTARSLSGSSSGAGAAIAAGLVPVALGSDTGGSIRAPAAFCGISGLKPTYGLVPRTGIVPLAFSLDHCGPMAWSSADCALILNAIAGYDPRDPASADVPRRDYTRGLRGGIAGMRIGVVRHFHERDLPADRRVVAAFDAALVVLRRLGAKIVNVKLPPFQDWEACGRILIHGESLSVHRRDLAERPGHYSRVTGTRLLAGEGLQAVDYVAALRWRRRLANAYAAALEGLDAVVSCTVLGLPPLMDSAAKPPFVSAGGALVTLPFNVAGVPALSVCMGFADGLPLGLQIAGRAFEDATVLRIGHAFEEATPWRDRRPPSPVKRPDPNTGKRRAAADGPSAGSLAAARAVVAAMCARLPADLAYDDEPSLIFRP